MRRKRRRRAQYAGSGHRAFGVRVDRKLEAEAAAAVLGRDDAGERVAAGSYLVRVRAGAAVEHCVDLEALRPLGIEQQRRGVAAMAVACSVATASTKPSL